MLLSGRVCGGAAPFAYLAGSSGTGDVVQLATQWVTHTYTYTHTHTFQPSVMCAMRLRAFKRGHTCIRAFQLGFAYDIIVCVFVSVCVCVCVKHRCLAQLALVCGDVSKARGLYEGLVGAAAFGRAVSAPSSHWAAAEYAALLTAQGETQVNVCTHTHTHTHTRSTAHCTGGDTGELARTHTHTHNAALPAHAVPFTPQLGLTPYVCVCGCRV